MTTPEEARSEDGDSLSGKVVAGNFRIERLIGSGAMGNVYRAEQLSLGKEVAVKVLHPHLASDDKLVRRFQREAKSASRLNHPNSIQIIDSGRDGQGVLYIAMELLEGRDLSQIIRDEFPLPIPRIVRIMSQVLSALDEAHTQGVIHRDLKPSNIMLIERRGESDFVKVCDYGIAKAQLEESAEESQMLTIQGLVCGTPEYMSPEQARGEPLDGRTDLYSAAVILYHMVTGDIPFRASTPIGIVSRHLSEVPAVPSARRQDPSIPADLDDLILRGLAKSRELRPGSAAIFREELESIGSGRMGRRGRGAETTLPAALQAPEREGVTVALRAAPPAPAARRSRRPLALGLLALACGVAGVISVLRRDPLPADGTSPVLSVGSLAGAAPSQTVGAVAAVAEGVPPPQAGPSAGEVALPRPALPKQPSTGSESAPGSPVGEAAPEAPGRELEHPALPSGTTASERTLRSARGPRAGARQGQTTHRPPSDRVTASRLPTINAPSATPPAAETPAPAKAAESVSPPSAAPPAARSAADTVREAEKLLSQGEIAEACRRGEEAVKAGGRLAAAHKFLGKCYMRGGDAARAKENYRRYLELAPDAADAMFIESIVK